MYRKEKQINSKALKERVCERERVRCCSKKRVYIHINDADTALLLRFACIAVPIALYISRLGIVSARIGFIDKRQELFYLCTDMSVSLYTLCTFREICTYSIEDDGHKYISSKIACVVWSCSQAWSAARHPRRLTFSGRHSSHTGLSSSTQAGKIYKYRIL